MATLRTLGTSPRLLAGTMLLILGGCHAPTPAPDRLGMDDYVAGARAYRAGDQNVAKLLLSHAVQQNPDLVMAHQLLGDLYRHAKDYGSASEQYQFVAQLDPYNYKSHYQLGVVNQFLQRLEKASDAYLRALALSPDDVNSTMNLGLVYLALGRTPEALRLLQKAVQLDPHSSAAQCNLGVAWDIIGDLDKAERAYERAIELDGNQTVAMVNLGTNLIRQGRAYEAAAALRAAAAKADTAMTRERLGDALVLEHHDDEALRQYNLALSLDPDCWPAMNQIGMILWRKYETAPSYDEDLRRSALIGCIAAWKKSLALNPSQPQIGEWVAHCDSVAEAQ